MDAPRDMILPPDLAQAVRDKAIEGGYADEMDVIRDGLAAIAEHEHDLNADQIAAIRHEHAAWRAGPRETVSMEEVRTRFEAERAKRL